MSDGFLSRWSRRKEAVRKGEEVAAEPQVADQPPPSAPPSPASGRGSQAAGAVAPSPLRGEGGGEGRPLESPPPTLEDAQALTPDADFSRFARPDVAPEVKSAAFRKLFSDPHFNRMDGLDVYIDDYSKPDPIPPKMLRQLASARFLNLFDDEEKAQAQPREVADAAGAQNVAQSGSRSAPASPPPDDHADPDLRLQQDDAPGPAGPGEGPR